MRTMRTMKTTKTLLINPGLKFKKIPFLFFLVILISVTSCLKESNTEFTPFADVFIQKKPDNGSVLYAPVYYVYGNQVISSASVTLPNAGGTITLSSISSDKFTYYKPVSENDFDFYPPDAGAYSFDITSAKGENLKVQDLLALDEIGLPVIAEATYKTNNSGIYVDWNAVTDADAYNVRLYSLSGDLIFSSFMIVNTKTDYTIDQLASGWQVNPVDKTVYLLEVHAYLFEEGATDLNYAYNVQCDAFSGTNVTWNP